MYYIGVDLGGTNMAVGLVNKDGEILYKNSAPTGMAKSHEVILNDMVCLCEDILQKNKLTYDDVLGIGIGVPGTVNPENGVIEYTSNLNFKNVDVKAFLKDKIKVPIFLDNDANCAALSENLCGAARGHKSAVAITLGTGVGGGIVLDGKVFTGAFFAAGEVGHHVIVSGGKLCNCGRRGCWEKYASATALIERAKEMMGNNKSGLIAVLCEGNADNIDAKMVFDACDKGDSDAELIVCEYHKYLAEGLTNIINILQPEAVVIGGGVSARGEKLLQPVRKLVDEMLYGLKGLQSKIVLAQLGNDGGIIGAAMLGRVSKPAA